MSTTPSASSCGEAALKYVCGIDIGSQSCAGCICRPDKSVVVKSMTFANSKQGWQVIEEKLSQLDAAPGQIVIGMEATSRSHENLYHELEQRGYQMRRLASRTNASLSPATRFAGQDRPARCHDHCPHFAVAGEARRGYIPGEQIATYRELVRLHTQLSDEAAAYQNEIQALVVVLTPRVHAGHGSIPACPPLWPSSKLFPVPRP